MHVAPGGTVEGEESHVGLAGAGEGKGRGRG